ncbi:unnamed protein product [Mesocestoides corti]|uniref:Uncharacterized protein n=2 Tax=Mesocestoides corti TaxID=53468 RepID=A0A0R3UGH8_MESCO|nr:unnamed protein product [Mesocestoides corti]
MAATISGNVNALKKIFENYNSTGSSPSSSIRSREVNGVSHATTRNSDSDYNAVKKPSQTPSKTPVNGTLHEQSCASGLPGYNGTTPNDRRFSVDRNSVDRSSSKSTPPKTKPKPVIFRHSQPVIPNNAKAVSNSPRVDAKNEKPLPADPSSLRNMTACESSVLTNTPSGPNIPSGKGSNETHAPSNLDNVVGKLPTSPLNGDDNAAVSKTPPTTSVHNSSKKPPPVSKKPRSVLSGYSNGNTHTHYKYDEELEKHFGLVVDQSSYDSTERWAAYQAENRLELMQSRSRKQGNDSLPNMLPNGLIGAPPRAPSITSSTGQSSSNLTNSSIRSILKKGRPSLGIQTKKRLTFKDGDELTTKYDYPSEDSFNDLDSLDRYRSAFDSDSDSSSTFDESQDFEYDNSGSVSTLRSQDGRINVSKLMPVASNSSTVSSSTLRGSVSNQRKKHENSSHNDHHHSKWSSPSSHKPTALNSSRGDSKSKNLSNPSVSFVRINAVELLLRRNSLFLCTVRKPQINILPALGHLYDDVK